MSAGIKPTRTYMNWVNVTITPAGGQAIAVTSVTDFAVNRSSKTKKFYGDNRLFARVAVSREAERGVVITTGDTSKGYAIPMNVPCVVTGTLLDPINGAAAGGGAYTLTLINAIYEGNKDSAKNNEFASGTISFTSFGGTADDGSEIDPLTTVYL